MSIKESMNNIEIHLEDIRDGIDELFNIMGVVEDEDVKEELKIELGAIDKRLDDIENELY